MSPDVSTMKKYKTETLLEAQVLQSDPSMFEMHPEVGATAPAFTDRKKSKKVNTLHENITKSIS